KHIIAMAIVHNINTYMAISLFILIYSTNPICSTQHYIVDWVDYVRNTGKEKKKKFKLNSHIYLK
ncbi:MAG: hypothetical protein J7K12_02840, partial [Thermoplasmata archaeon]|nr:hypothetical protein [Thermoplasmata archaeon]